MNPHFSAAVYNMTYSFSPLLDLWHAFFWAPAYHWFVISLSPPLASVSLVPLSLLTQALTSGSSLYIFSFLISTFPRCISYLLLHNEVPQTVAAENSKHLLSQSSFRSGIQECLGRWFCLKGPCVLQSRCWPRLQSSPCQGMMRGLHFQAHSCGYWKTSILCHMCFSMGLHHNVTVGFPKGKWFNRKHTIWKPQSFYNLIWEVTAHHFYHILYITIKSIVLSTQDIHTWGGHDGAVLGTKNHPGLSHQL